MKYFRIVTDIGVPDQCPDATLEKLASEAALMVAYGVKKEPWYGQSTMMVDMNHYGTRRLDAAPEATRAAARVVTTDSSPPVSP